MKKYIRPVIFLALVIWTALNIVFIFAPVGYITLEAFALMLGGIFSAWLEWETVKLLSRLGLTYEDIEA